MKQVATIIERCAEGTCVSRPFRVRVDDGDMYWIKGCGLGWNRRELCYELLAARLAEALALPVASYAVVDVPQSLLEYCGVQGIEALRAGPAFGSLHVEAGVSLPPVAVDTVPPLLRQRILLFDWWIQNEDRSLSALGGNVNLLWNAAARQLTIIDHNNAFDPGFDEVSFFENHVFRDERMRMAPAFVLEQAQLFAKVSALFGQYTQDFPDEWATREMMPGDFVPETVIEVLGRFGKLTDVFRGECHD